MAECVTKNTNGSFSVKTSDGKYHGTFKNKDMAMERLWSVDNRKKFVKGKEREMAKKFY